MSAPVRFVPTLLASLGEFDSLVLVFSDLKDIPDFVVGKETLAQAAQFDKAAFSGSANLYISPELPFKRLIASPTGPVNRDYDDVRQFGEAAAAGVVRAKKAGSTKPLLVFAYAGTEQRYPRAIEASLLQILQALYEPLQGRENKIVSEVITELGFFVAGSENRTEDYVRLATVINAIEAGRRLARDLGGPDPERMSPLNFAAYVEKAFASRKNVKVEVQRDSDYLLKEYPLLHAVARASIKVERHRPCVVRLTYTPTNAGSVQQRLLFAGKGVTYDTGGADVKTGGHMAGMSRDKCGASNIAGLVLTASLLETENVQIIAELGMVRNSIGSDSYVADEVIRSHGGAYVKVGNTDAEGRMVLTDLVSHLRVDALENPANSHIFTVATLTGHAPRAVGPYTIGLDNGPANLLLTSNDLQRIGHAWGDPLEVSYLRREDYKIIAPQANDYEILQCNSAPSTMTSRGHQFPAAFIIIGSGLDKHGNNNSVPIRFSHIDIAGSGVENMDWQLGKPTGSSIIMFTAKYLL